MIALLTFALLSPVMLVTLFFIIEVVVGLAPLPRAVSLRSRETKVAIIVPAHNEALVIGGTLTGLRDAAGELARLVVVADNCTDRTADIAREFGAEVLERFDERDRGKGFALDFARQHLRTSPPDVALVLDADCTINSTSLDALGAACSATRQPCQGAYLLSPSPNASPFVQISTFAFCLKNLVRQRALHRLAGRVHLTGTGMAFPWSIFERADLATRNIVEDLQLGIDLAEQGHACLLVEEARVWSAPATEQATLVQRQRWEGGFITTMVRAAPRALWRALRGADRNGVLAALDLFIPPVALLLLLDVAALIAGAVATLVLGAPWWPVALQGALMLLAGFVIMIAWHLEGRSFISLLGLAKAPIYLVRKLALYSALARSGAPKEWIRTERGEE